MKNTGSPFELFSVGKNMYKASDGLLTLSVKEVAKGIPKNKAF